MSQLPALATYSDLENRLGITMTQAEQTRATALLADASDLVRAAAKQTITRVADDVLVIPGRWADRILLPERPVISVSSVTAAFYDGTAIDLPPEGYYVDRDELVRYAFPIGLMRHFFTTGNGWLGEGYRLTITYTHGYDQAASPTPYPLSLAKRITVAAAARVWVNPAAASQLAIAGKQEMYPNVGMELTDVEEKKIADVFRRTTQTVTLR